jgi:hypothetical protein
MFVLQKKAIAPGADNTPSMTNLLVGTAVDSCVELQGSARAARYAPPHWCSESAIVHDSSVRRLVVV